MFWLNHDPTTIDGKVILRVYTGRQGCACGCRGKYSTNPATIRRVVNHMKHYPFAGSFDNNRAARTDKMMEIDGCCFSVAYETPGGTMRTMTAYYDSAE